MQSVNPKILSSKFSYNNHSIINDFRDIRCQDQVIFFRVAFKGVRRALKSPYVTKGKILLECIKLNDPSNVTVYDIQKNTFVRVSPRTYLGVGFFTMV
jgi:hypothetical protein